LEKDYGIYLGETTIRKIMALNRRIHRYLDAKPAGIQLYSTLLLEGLSRTILAGSLTTEQELGVVLHVYFQALLRWGLWKEIISDLPWA
jgi:hypothetical protein